MKMLALLAIFAIVACTDDTTAKKGSADAITVDVMHLTDGGEVVGEQAGEIIITPIEKGTSFYVKASGITPGEHGFHIHEFPALEMSKSGDHWDPAGTKSHKGPLNTNGHRGDLPFLTADANGMIDQTVIAPNVMFEEVTNKSLMIHEGGDNYTDIPDNGGGGGRMMAAIIE